MSEGRGCGNEGESWVKIPFDLVLTDNDNPFWAIVKGTFLYLFNNFHNS